MIRPRLFALWLGLAVCFGFGCRTANLLAEPPTSIPPAPSPLARATPTIPAPTPVPPPLTPSPSEPPPASPSPVASPTLPPAPSVAALPAGCASPQVITSPAHESAVSGLIEVTGTANTAGMQYWKVEYRAETSTEYIVLNRGEKAIVNDVLARLSTKTLPNGVYWLRLVIVQKDGNFGTPCEIRVTFAN